MMNIKTESGNIVEVSMGLITIPLKDVKVKDIDELEQHVKYFEDHMPAADEGFPWTKEEMKVFLDNSSKKQLNMLKELLKHPDGIKTKDLIDKLGHRVSQAIAGIMAGFTRRAKKEFKNRKHPFIEQKWSNTLWMNIYWIKKEYFSMIKEYFSNKNSE